MPGSVICSAMNISDIAGVIVTIQIIDATGGVVQGTNCSVGPQGSCSLEAALKSGGPPSPFKCFIHAHTNVLETPVRGSICGTVGDPRSGLPGSPYCLQALLDNGESGGWGPP
jgi:hypothetical protein